MDIIDMEGGNSPFSSDAYKVGILTDAPLCAEADASHLICLENNDEDNICVKIWSKCVSWISKEKLEKISKYTRQFDETMTIVYLIIIMGYIHYKK